MRPPTEYRADITVDMVQAAVKGKEFGDQVTDIDRLLAA